MIKHYRRNLIWMKLGILRVEVLKVEDQVDMIEMMLKMTWIRPGYRTVMVVIKKRVEQIDPCQKWNASSVASTTTTQENVDRQATTTMARLST